MMNYRDYILSHKWTKLANQIKKRDKGCLVCKRAVNLNVHHGTYQHLGQEFEEELFTLCAYHHEALHLAFKKSKRKKRKGSLLSFTKNFIKDNSGVFKRNRVTRVDIQIEVPVDESLGTFSNIFKRMSAQFPKKPIEYPVLPAQFKSRNQLSVEERQRMKKERRRSAGEKVS